MMPALHGPSLADLNGVPQRMMDDPSANSEVAELVRRVAAGEPAARDALCARYYPQVQQRVHRELDRDFRRHHRWILPLFSTGDVVQDVFVSVLSALDASFTPADEDALVRYLSTLCRNRLVDAVRHHEADRRDPRRQVRPSGPDAGLDDSGDPWALPGDDPTPSVAAALGEHLRVFREVLDTFPEQTRALLELRLCDELAFDEIAERLGWATANAAGKAFRSARARLLLRLQERGVQPPGGAVDRGDDDDR